MGLRYIKTTGTLIVTVAQKQKTAIKIMVQLQHHRNMKLQKGSGYEYSCSSRET
jgi:hypothetical protein